MRTLLEAFFCVVLCCVAFGAIFNIFQFILEEELNGSSI